MIDPTAEDEDPRKHIALLPRTGQFEALTPKGSHSIDVFGLFRTPLATGRQDAWRSVQLWLKEYDAACAKEHYALALVAQRVLCRHPFASVLCHMLGFLGDERADDLIEVGLLDAECRRIAIDRPEIYDWP